MEPRLREIAERLKGVYGEIERAEEEVSRVEGVVEQAEQDLAAVEDFKSVSVLGRLRGLFSRFSR